jgi:hypothetical protein
MDHIPQHDVLRLHAQERQAAAARHVAALLVFASGVVIAAAVFAMILLTEL